MELKKVLLLVDNRIGGQSDPNDCKQGAAIDFRGSAFKGIFN